MQKYAKSKLKTHTKTKTQTRSSAGTEEPATTKANRTDKRNHSPDSSQFSASTLGYCKQQQKQQILQMQKRRKINKGKLNGMI